MNTYQRALRDFQDAADDLTRANYNNCNGLLRRVAATVVPTTPLGDVVAALPSVAFEPWYDKQVATVSSMVGSGTLTWPDDRLERLSLQVGLIRRLAAGQLDISTFCSNFMWESSHYNDNIAEFIQQIFRPFVRDFLRFAHETQSFADGLQDQGTLTAPNAAMTDNITLFISHSARDAAVAKALVSLFEKALKISARQIRCTSVDGYRLSVGASTNEVLRTEVFGATLFVALLTPGSLSSPYVLFELGARWGSRRPLFPVLACGATSGDLPEPLSGINALSASTTDQVRQLVEDAAAALAATVEPMAVFSAEIEALVAVSARDA